jgi:lipopolysaccharide export system permease protein
MTLAYRLKRGIRAVTGPFLRLHARTFFTSVVLQVFTIMLLVEAVFLAERFPMVFRDVFRHHADPVDTLLLFLCESPAVFDLALATAILIAVYWTTVRMRENRELLVLFAAGTGPYRFIGLVLAIAILGQIGSLTVSGVIDPLSRYAERVILFKATVRVLTNGINTGQFYQFPHRVAYAPPSSATSHDGIGFELTRGLFVYEQSQPGIFRVITSDHAKLQSPDARGRMLLKLGGFTSHTFSDTASPTPARIGGLDDSRAMLSASDVTQELSLDELMSFLPRGSKNDEVTFVEQFTAKPDPQSPKYRAQMRLLGERFARSLLCLLAPLIALASVCLTTRRTNYFVLPLACMGLMSLNVTSEWLIRAIVPVDPFGAVGIPLALMAGFAVLLLAEIVRGQGRLALPQLARP